MPLPTQKTPALARMGNVLLFAEPKTGKSTLAASLDPDHTILLDVEDGLAAIEGFKHPINSWGHIVGTTGEGRAQRAVYDDNSLLGAARLIAEANVEAKAKGEPPQFRVGVIDTADALAQLCSDYVLGQLGANAGSTGFVHASDFDYGKGWSAITQEWQTRIAALARYLDSLILVSHADRRTRTTRAGAEFDVFSTNLGPKGIKEWTTGFVDHILFLHMLDTDDGPVRGIRTRQNPSWQAGGRTIAGGPQLPDPILLPDATTSGKALREALEQVTAPQTAAPVAAVTDDVAAAEGEAPEPKPKAKTAAKKKPAAAKPVPEQPQRTLEQIADDPPPNKSDMPDAFWTTTYWNGSEWAAPGTFSPEHLAKIKEKWLESHAPKGAPTDG